LKIDDVVETLKSKLVNNRVFTLTILGTGWVPGYNYPEITPNYDPAEIHEEYLIHDTPFLLPHHF